jgi:hypothetical protein
MAAVIGPAGLAMFGGDAARLVVSAIHGHLPDRLSARFNDVTAIIICCADMRVSLL